MCALNEERNDLQVLGFPCNQFGAQEPGTDEEIQAFAKDKYDVNFQLFSKIDVNGENTCELYEWLKANKSNPDGKSNIGWNFTKFLVNGKGEVVARFEPMTTPEEISQQLDELL